MRALGNTVHETNFVGLVLGTRQNDSWLVVINYIKEGYIKDDAAKDWNADDLLKNLKEGVEESDEDRAARGFPEMEVIGSIEPPIYDAVAHRLVWSILGKDKGAPDDARKDVNYNTYALGPTGIRPEPAVELSRIATTRGRRTSCSLTSPINPASVTRISAPRPTASPIQLPRWSAASPPSSACLPWRSPSC